VKHESTVSDAGDRRAEYSAICVNDAQAAKLLGISRSGLHRFVRLGLLPKPVKLGRRSLYRVSEIKQMIELLGARYRERASSERGAT
jgi:predicted DNA-binding transcriptional regulator AlpA